MPPLNDPRLDGPGRAGAGRAYWRSLDHLADTPEFRVFMHREFPAGASELLDSDDRRHFLKIMGASMALAGMGLAGCRRWPEEHITPFARRPDGRDPGLPVSYATCVELGGVASGLLVTSFDGRPTKIEGNPEHPTSLGAADMLSQASVLDLYDPDRSQSPMRFGSNGGSNGGEKSTWDAFAAWAHDHFGAMRSNRGAGLAILSEATSSPSTAAMKQRLLSTFPDARWYEYEPLHNDNEVEGAMQAFGMAYRTQLDLESARVVVSFESDLLGRHPNAVANIRGFARSRRVGRGIDGRRQAMSRLYVAESGFSVTGANADHRVAIRSGDVALAAAYLAARVLEEPSLRSFEEDASVAAALSPATRRTLDHALEDLAAHHGASVIVAGSGQPAEVHYLVHLMNQALGNVGTTVHYTAQRDQLKHVESLRSLAGRESIDTLLILGGNPVFNAPADLDFASVLARAGTSIHLSDYRDETSTQCTWHVNRAHYLESWSDGRSWDGTLTIGQPLIEPLFQGVTPTELLAVAIGDDVTTGHEIVRRTYSEMLGGSDEAQWRSTLHAGLLAGSAFTLETPTAEPRHLDAIAASLFTAVSQRGGWEVSFSPHPTLYDGRFANNGWLQETPDPLTKLTWDNAVIMSPNTAADLGVTDGDLVRLERGRGGPAIEGAALRLPGIADGTVSLHLGGGRRMDGRIAAGAGFDFYRLRTSDGMGFAAGFDLTRARGHYPLAITQDHHTIDPASVGGRGVQARIPSLYREADLDEFRRHPDFAARRTHVVHQLSQWGETNLAGAQYAWAMTIDLNACVGCGNCIVACQAENNIPIVGKDQVRRNREMHWLRVDRYFTFPPSTETKSRYDANSVSTVALQPVICMMCENAPCEQVCPVAATVHDKDGLNVMIYNRCIGTRYCSNNCPYKVRRFNYFDYHRRDPHRASPGKLLHVDPSYFTEHQATPDGLLSMQFNPEVTVRMRGVMEKCTYCVQRIRTARIDAKNAYAERPAAEKQTLKDHRVAIADGTITPACAQTCPAEALVFGDLKDPGSRVSRLQRDVRSYEMLEELNVKARTKYLAKIRNPFPAAGQGEAGHEGQSGEPAGGDGHSRIDSTDTAENVAHA